MRKRAFVFFAVATVLPAALVLGYPGGMLASHSRAPANLTKANPSCGSCHRAANVGRVAIDFVSAMSIKRDVEVPATLTVAQASVPGRTGGFSLTTSSGELIPGSSMKTDSTKRELTHTSKNSRSWAFKFKPTRTGLIQWHTVAMASDGSGTRGDRWGFYGPDTDVPGTPYRIFANDSAIDAFGTSCKGTDGFKPVIGMATNAAGNVSSPIELHNAKPNIPVLFLIGASNTNWGPFPLPFDLTVLGATGCSLRVSMDFMLVAVTTGSGSGNGSAILPLTVPNGLKRLTFYTQAMAFDSTANSFGLITSMGLKVVVQ